MIRLYAQRIDFCTEGIQNNEWVNPSLAHAFFSSKKGPKSNYWSKHNYYNTTKQLLNSLKSDVVIWTVKLALKIYAHFRKTFQNSTLLTALAVTLAATCTWYWQSLQRASVFLYAISASCHCREVQLKALHSTTHCTVHTYLSGSKMPQKTVASINSLIKASSGSPHPHTHTPSPWIRSRLLPSSVCPLVSHTDPTRLSSWLVSNPDQGTRTWPWLPSSLTGHPPESIHYKQ